MPTLTHMSASARQQVAIDGMDMAIAFASERFDEWEEAGPRHVIKSVDNLVRTLLALKADLIDATADVEINMVALSATSRMVFSDETLREVGAIR